MLIDITQNEAEILFEIVRSRCPDFPRDTEECRALDKLYDLFAAKLGYETDA